jgi:hypothetical protein
MTLLRQGNTSKGDFNYYQNGGWGLLQNGGVVAWYPKTSDSFDS